MTAREATPIRRAVAFVWPSRTPSTKARASGIKPVASMENPNNFGNCPTITVRAMPLT